MAFFNASRKLALGLLALFLVSYGWRLHAQQGALTPPQRPAFGTPLPGPTTTPGNRPAPVAASGAPFVVGEHLTYSISWSSFASAARVDLEVAGQGQFFGRDSYQIKTKVETLNSARSLFGEVDNEYTTYAAIPSVAPHRIVSSVRQGKTQVEQIATLDPAKHQAIFSDDTTVELPAEVYDLPSLVYALRLRPLSEGWKQKFVVLHGKQLIEVEAEATGRESVQTQVGTFNALRVRLQPRKEFSKFRTLVYFSDDARRLPVQIKSRLPFGEARAELVNISVNVRPGSIIGKIDAPRDESGNVIITPIPGPTPNDGGRAYPFIVGERLNYNIAWGNFDSVGKASFEVRQQGMLNGNRVFEFFGEAASVGVTRQLVAVDDQISSVVLADSLTPLKNDVRLREGKRLRQTVVNFDWQRRAALLSNGTATPVGPGTLDLVSLFYAMRAADWQPGAARNFGFLDANQRLQVVTVRHGGQEAINTALGPRDAIKLDILAPAPAQLLIAQVWLSNDARRLPLYFVTRTRFGEVRFQVTGAVNTK